MFSNTVALQRLITKHQNINLKSCFVKGYICCLDAQSKVEIFKGFKGHVLDNENMWSSEDYVNIMSGQLTTIQRKDLIQEKDMSKLLKAFVESNITNHTVSTDSLIRKYGVYVCTGCDFYSIFGLDFSKLTEQRESEAKRILSSTIDEKCVNQDEDTIRFVKSIYQQFNQFDLSKKNKNKLLVEQIDLF